MNETQPKVVFNFGEKPSVCRKIQSIWQTQQWNRGTWQL